MQLEEYVKDVVNKIICFGSGFVNKRIFKKVSRKAQSHFTNNKDMEFDSNETKSDNEEQGIKVN